MWIFLSWLTDQRFTRYYFCKLDQNLKKLVTTNPWKNLYNSLHTNLVFELNTHIKLVCSAKIHFQSWSSYRFCNNVCLNVKSKCLKKFCFEGCFSLARHKAWLWEKHILMKGSLSLIYLNTHVHDLMNLLHCEPQFTKIIFYVPLLYDAFFAFTKIFLHLGTVYK